MINDFMSITELARVTGRTRPTIYKYIKDYEEKNFDNIPYTFLMLFEMTDKEDCTKRAILEYCEKFYSKKTENNDPLIKEIFDIIEENKDKINLENLKNNLLEEIKNND